MTDRPFRIALNMAGAVSAGAYTAGVLDFLVEALDTWYQLRGAENRAAVQTHDVVLEALTGASAGGMCAAISAVALKEEFDHVRNSDPGEKTNRLYKNWVQTIDIAPLLGTKDLDRDPVVRSVLDCTPIEEIANAALVANPVRRKDRPWVSENLGLVVTISNLRGIPYTVDQTGNNFEERIGYHADQVEFIVNSSGQSTSQTALVLGYPDQPKENWDALRTAAMATGAFPVALRARIVQKKKTYYERKLWRVANSDPSSDGSCSREERVEPAWDHPPDTFDIVCADGGITNNNPFDCAHDLLVRASGNRAHVPRAASEADAAVISVAPFPGNEPFGAYDAEEQSSLINVLKSLLPTLVSQARFQGENLLLTGDPDVHSRFAIAPSDDLAPEKPALLCGVLGAFGGFIDQKFRDRDYHLGRRNCQQFLRVHFCLPESNPVIAAGLPVSEEAKKRWAVDPPAEATTDRDKRWFPVIPLMESVQGEVVPPLRENARTGEARIDAVADQAAERVKRVIHALIDHPGSHHPFWGFAVNAVSPVLEGRLKSYIRQTIVSQLQASGQM
jgi:hypothetical protein